MKKKSPLKKSDLLKIDKFVELYRSKMHLYNTFSTTLFTMFSEHSLLYPLIHSLKHRIKDPDHLHKKICRKFLKAKSSGEIFELDEESLFNNITDLAGVRILHLHTEQIGEIDKALKHILDEQKLPILEGPVANTWDVEYEDFYKSLGIEVSQRKSLYTSVHYLTKAGNDVIAEIQIRTLFDEVWGEVSHKINYPKATESIACKEQIKVLARVTSSGTRLVDSIFKSHEEFVNLNKKAT